MSIYLLIGLVALYLIYSKISKGEKGKSEDQTPPIFERKGSGSLFETIFKDIFDDSNKEKHTNSHLKEEVKIQNGVKKNEVIEVKIEERKESKQDITDEFDLRKAIIYAEILNNPYIKK